MKIILTILTGIVPSSLNQFVLGHIFLLKCSSSEKHTMYLF